MENETCRQPMLLEKAVCWLAIKAKENAVPLLSAIVFGILAHMFAFTNKLVNHDEVFTLFFKGGTVSLGRWGLGALDSIFPNYSMPWIYGIITILLIASAACLIIHIFGIRSKLLQILLAGSIVVFPSLTGTFGYMFTSSSYALSFLLSVLAVWLLQKKTPIHSLFALGCMVFSISIYQSYIAVTASLLVVLLIQQLLHKTDIRPVILRGIFFVVFLGVSLGIYYALTQVVLALKDVTLNSYASSRLSFTVSAILSSISLAYRNFFGILTDHTFRLIPSEFSGWIHWLCLGAAAVLLVIWFAEKQEKKTAPVLLLAALLVVLPLAINCMYLFTSEEAIHTLVLYSFISVYVLVAVIADACLSSLSGHKLTQLCRCAALNLLTICLAVIIIANTYVANESYLNLYLRYENAFAFYTSLAADIKMMPEFDENTKLAVIGQWDELEMYETNFEFTHELTGVTGFKPDSYSKERYLDYYIGFPIPFASDAEIAEIQASAEYQEMAVYPYYGSLQMFGDVLVVKLS